MSYKNKIIRSTPWGPVEFVVTKEALFGGRYQVLFQDLKMPLWAKREMNATEWDLIGRTDEVAMLLVEMKTPSFNTLSQMAQWIAGSIAPHMEIKRGGEQNGEWANSSNGLH